MFLQGGYQTKKHLWGMNNTYLAQMFPELQLTGFILPSKQEVNNYITGD